MLAFGFDEEASGFHGAQFLAQHIESVYGKYGIAMIVDEGGLSIATPPLALWFADTNVSSKRVFITYLVQCWLFLESRRKACIMSRLKSKGLEVIQAYPPPIP